MTFISIDPSKSPILKARRRVVTGHHAKLNALTRRMGNAIRIDLKTGLTQFKRKITPEKLSEAYHTMDYGKVVESIGFNKLEDHVKLATSHIRVGIYDSALLAWNDIPRLTANPNNRLRYDVSNPSINHYINTKTANLVTLIDNDTKGLIQNTIRRSFSEALSPKRVADIIRPNIGLNERQQIALANFQFGMEQKGMDQSLIDRNVANYGERLLDQRTMAIASTESRNAVNQGQVDVWQEALAQQLLDPDSEKEWKTDGAPCEICEPMNGVRVGINESWEVDLGKQGTKEVFIPSETHPNCYCTQLLVKGDGGQSAEPSDNDEIPDDY
jgi:hypothetical protein